MSLFPKGLAHIIPCATLMVQGLLAIPALSVVPVLAQDSCKSSLDNVRSDIENRIGGRLVSVRSDSVSPNSPFPERPSEVSITLYGEHNGNSRFNQKSLDIMNSKALTLQYARQILQACDSYSKVSIGIDHSDYVTSFSLLPSGEVREDECVGFQGPGVWPKWGQMRCL
jgi:hypothetical protein